MLYVHHVHGRLRVRSRRLRNNASALHGLCDRLNALPGIREARGNALTGSVLVHYDPAVTTVESIWERLHREGLAPAPRPDLGGNGSRMDEAADRIASFAVNYAVEKLIERSAMAIVGAII